MTTSPHVVPAPIDHAAVCEEARMSRRRIHILLTRAAKLLSWLMLFLACVLAVATTGAVLQVARVVGVAPSGVTYPAGSYRDGIRPAIETAVRPEMRFLQGDEQ